MTDKRFFLQLPNPIRVCIINLGCPKNRVDAELIAGQLADRGCVITESPTDADAVIINTCTFIEPAIRESRQWFNSIKRVRNTINKNLAILITGCVPQYLGKTTRKFFPSADAIGGVGEIQNIFDLLVTALAHRQLALSDRQIATSLFSIAITNPPSYLHTSNWPRIRFAPEHYTYVKIAEGCSHGCSFCVIPRVRGPYRSRTINDILQECREALRNGVKELNLVAQDTTAFGKNAPNPHQSGTLAELLRRLQTLPGNFWIRILYTHPAHWTDELIDVMQQSEKVVPYVDLPLQHINDQILHSMNRRVTRAQIETLINKLRNKIPNLTLRTSFIVGFPGETEEAFQELLEFVQKTRFDRLGAFRYWPMPGTYAANLPNQIPDHLKSLRLEKLMKIQRGIAKELNRAKIGRVMTVLADAHANLGQLPEKLRNVLRETQPHRLRQDAIITIARTPGDAPEIDTWTYIVGNLPVGQFHQIEIVDSYHYDLIGIPK